MNAHYESETGIEPIWPPMHNAINKTIINSDVWKRQGCLRDIWAWYVLGVWACIIYGDDMCVGAGGRE